MAAGAMTGAESVLRTLSAGGVQACFANPGTSEMHLVAALDRVPEVRPVLALFEGVASGAADGYGRMAGIPAATLLHLGPGLGNAFANLHNAYKARTPIVNVVGDHAVRTRRSTRRWRATSPRSRGPCRTGTRAPRTPAPPRPTPPRRVAAARSHGGEIATLVVPADAGWDASAGPAAPLPLVPPAPVPEGAVEAAARALRSGEPAALLLGGAATRGPALRAAARIAAATGARLIHDTFPSRLERGAGDPARGAPPLPDRDGHRGAGRPGPPRRLRHAGAGRVLRLPRPAEPARRPGDRRSTCSPGRARTSPARWRRSRTRSALPRKRPSPTRARPELPAGALDPAAIGAAVAALLPEGAIVVDESVTASAPIVAATAGAAPHDWLTLTGGAIGQGLPVATGAAVACPGRPVLSLEGDGSAMYTIQSLWTQARESLDVTTVIFANRSYAILDFELSRVGAEARGPAAEELFGIGRPDLDFVALARSMGVPGRRAEDAESVHGRAARGPGRARAAADRGADLGGVRRERQHRQAADDRAAEQPDHRAVAPQAALGADVGAAAGAGDGVGARAAAAGRAGGRGEAAEERAHVFRIGWAGLSRRGAWRTSTRGEVGGAFAPAPPAMAKVGADCVRRCATGGTVTRADFAASARAGPAARGAIASVTAPPRSATATAAADHVPPACASRRARRAPTGAASRRTPASRPACPSASARSAPRRAGTARRSRTRRAATARSGPRPSPRRPPPTRRRPPREQLARLELARARRRPRAPARPERRAAPSPHRLRRLERHPLARVHDLLGRGRRPRALGQVDQRPAPAGALAQRGDERPARPCRGTRAAPAGSRAASRCRRTRCRARRRASPRA